MTTVKKILESSDDIFSLPTEPTVADENVSSLILYGLPKCGKTTILSKLPGCLIIDTENGSSNVSALIKKVPDNTGPVGKLQWLDKFADVLLESGKPYDYVAIDTLTEVDEWSEWSGTYRYMNTPMGKSFNRELDNDGKPIKGGPMLKPSDDAYESVHTLPDGFGYRWSRGDLRRIFDKYKSAAKKCVIYICHVEDKYITLDNKETVTVMPRRLALTGKLRAILPRNVSAVGYVYNKDGVINVSFVGSDEKVGGVRSPHLAGYEGPLDWNLIFKK